MSRRGLMLLLLLAFAVRVSAQEILGDVFSGKLINPEVGVWAGYELKDKSSGSMFYLRQAIVGTEEVKKKPGFWVETELRPAVGFPTIYKMLLTGPASDPKNVHQLIVKDGNNAPESVPVPQEGYTSGSNGERTLVGSEKVKIGSGDEIDAQHFTVGTGDAKADVWLNDTVRPMGIVKMTSSDGELLLQRSGTGGEEAKSVIDAYSEEMRKNGGDGKVKVEVRVNGEKKDAPAKKDKAPEAAPAPSDGADKPAATPKPAKKSKAKERSK